MGKRYMTLADLYNFYFSQNKNQTFSQKDNGDTIVVRTDGKLNFSKSESKDGLYPTRVQMNFVGDNLNGSRIEMKAQEKALSSSHYRPLLAYIHEVDGEPQFYGHNMEIEDDGEITYLEQPVGVIAEEAHMEHDDEYGKDYAVALGYIWEEYSKAAYILDRDGKCDVSVELSIRSLSYDAKDKILVLDDFFYSGCSILGCNEDGDKVMPAMPGSNITLADFSSENNSIKFEHNDKLIETLEKLNNTLSRFNINDTTRKEDNSVDLENKEIETMEESVKKKIEDDDSVVVTTEEEIENSNPLEDAPTVVDVEDDENEIEVNNESEVADENVETESETEPENDTTETFEEDEDSEELEKTTEDENNEVEDTEEFKCGDDKKKKKCSIEIDGVKKEFSVSLNSKIEALSCLVNDTYADDMTWYSVEVFEKNLVMVDMWTGHAFRQDYKSKGDSYSLKGDRVAVYATWMTSDEQKSFEEMKGKFEVISDKLAKYEAEPEKLEILSSDEYVSIAGKAEFEALKEQKNHFDLSIDELKAKADEIILSYAKKGELTFSCETESATEKIVTRKQFGAKLSSGKRSRYGGLGKKED